MKVSGGGSRQVGRLQLIVAELHDRVQPEHGEVKGGRAVHSSSGRSNPVENERSLGDATAPASELFRNADANPSAGGHRLVELPRECVFGIARCPVLVIEV